MAAKTKKNMTKTERELDGWKSYLKTNLTVDVSQRELIFRKIKELEYKKCQEDQLRR